MPTRYKVPTVESIIEDSEDESRNDVRGTEPEFQSGGITHRQHQSIHHSTMSSASTKLNTTRERDRSRKMHKSIPNGSRHSAPPSKPKSKNINAKRPSGSFSKGNEMEGQRLRQTPAQLSRDSSSSSSSSSSDEEEHIPDHKSILANSNSRPKLTSPSTISNLTSLTTATNNSSSSSGSNSTVTQASITKQSCIGNEAEIKKESLSPAVPSPPNVFAYLQQDSDGEDEREEEEEEEEREEGEVGDQKDVKGGKQKDTSNWLINHDNKDFITVSRPHTPEEHPSGPSSVSSSLHSDDFSAPEADIDTDRSTSPERSVHARGNLRVTTNSKDASIKLASQIAAANQRQNYYGAAPSFGPPKPQAHHRTDSSPLSPSDLETPRNSHPPKHSLCSQIDPTITGYELLASRLSSSSHSGSDTVVEDRIKPMYRKFEALNHRLLLHLQDEISELEEQLQRLDKADTESRRLRHTGNGNIGIDVIPASRRASEQMGGDLQWHKIDILGRIGYKLAQYNQTLNSFHSIQSLPPASRPDISHYRHYLQTARPITEVETRFLDPKVEDDLISIASNSSSSRSQQSHQIGDQFIHQRHGERFSSSSSSSTSNSSNNDHLIKKTPTSTPLDSLLFPPPHNSILPPPSHAEDFPTLALAIALSILIPILTFATIPTFLGRMTVVCLVGSGIVGALIQSGLLGIGDLLGSIRGLGSQRREGLVCVGVYLACMGVLAGVVG